MISAIRIFQTRSDNEKKKRKVCMQNVNKKFRTWGAFLFLLFFAVCVSVFFSATRVKADTETGFVTINGKSYYINKDGSKQKGWLELDGKKYYFNASTGVSRSRRCRREYPPSAVGCSH